MFGAPERITTADGEAAFRIPVNVGSLGVTFEYDTSGVVPVYERQPMFRTLQNTVLSELVKQDKLFKVPPSLDSLNRITPDWGFISSGAGYKLSPYTILKAPAIDAAKLPCMVDMRLTGIEMSRTTVKPIFQLSYAGPKANTIDFEWAAPAKPAATEDPDIEEVNELPAEDSNDVFLLSDPATKARQRMEAKMQVRAAFVAAQEARHAAKEMADKFFETYDVSDSESAFTEWESDSDESTES